MISRSVTSTILLLLACGVVRAQNKVPDFETQVIPVFTKVGCNSGACHGAAIGRGGFKLSLLGYDPDADYESLIHQYEGRRVHRAKPLQSLVLRKPSGQLPHEGGIPLSKSSEGFQIVLKWIEGGAPRAPSRELVRLDVSPASQLLAKPGDRFALKVTATFSNGASEDVTQWAVLEPADDTAVFVNRKGKVTAKRPGRHVVMVRFLNEVTAVPVVVPLHDTLDLKNARPRQNFVDDHINKMLDQLKLPHSPPCDDVTFVRRVYLDLIGTLPEPKEVDAFLAEQGADKRSQLVNRLMKRPEFVDYWSYKWGDLLRIESKNLKPEGVAAFHKWIRKQVADNTPLDDMARTMLLSQGDGYKTGPVNFLRVPGNPGEQAEYVSQVFMGVRLKCANCHNHPLDRWTQNDYHGLAAVFAKLKRGRVIELKERGEVIHPKTGNAALPRIPGEKTLADTEDLRKPFTEWLTSPDNPYFARTAVNRIWRELMGRGLVEPIDDHRPTNPPTHPELLDALASDFVKNGFDVRRTIRVIIASAAYQRSSLSVQGNREDKEFYSRYLIRPLPPTVLVDAVVKVTGVPEKLGNLPLGTSAIALGDSLIKSQPLDLLGRCSRQEDCTPTGNAGGGLTLALHTMHGPWLNAKIAHPKGRLRQLLQSNKNDAEIVREMYRVALGRNPTSAESAFWTKQFASLPAKERERAFEDFFWGLLNSSEFRTNH